MLQRPLSAFAATLTLVLAGSAAATAQGVSLSHAGSGARAAGMADAFVAVSDDGTAASWNPAGLAQLRQPEFSFVYAVSERGATLSGLRSADDRFAYVIRDPFRTVASSVDFASAALPFSIARNPITLQASWHRLYQLTNAFGGEVERYLTADLTSPASSSYIEDRLSGSIDVISVAGAVKLTRSTSIGGSVDFWRGDWVNQTLLVENADGAGKTAFTSLDAKAKTRGTTASIGLLLTYPAWNAGLVYHAPFWSDISNEVHVRASSAPPASGTVHGRFRLPRSIAGGVAWRPAARWTAAAAVTHDQWTDALVEGMGLPGQVNFFDELPPALSSTRDTVSLNLGVEHLFVRDAAIVPLRLGLGWEPQGQMDTVVRDPIDYLLFSAGTGYNTNRFKFDAAVQLRRASARETVNFTVATQTSSEDFVRDAFGLGESHEWRLKFSAIYRLQDTGKLKGILRKIFG
jgi:long-chain fatty acid transport protein